MLWFILLITVLAIIAFAVSLLLTLPREYQVIETIEVDTTVDKAFRKVRDLQSWADWSPWLLHEKEASLNYSDTVDAEQSYLAWQGALVGEGRLTHLTIKESEYIEQRLDSIKPYKSQSEVRWDFQSTENGVRITWSLNGRLPWFVSWMTEDVRRMLSNDYQLGLLLLQRQLVEAPERFEINFEGVQERQSVKGVYQSFATSFEELPNAMAGGYQALFEQIKQDGLSVDEENVPLAAYRNTNLKAGTTECDVLVPLASIDEVENSKIIGGGRAYKVTYSGNYHHLRLVWPAVYSHLYMSKVRADKNRAALEVYVTGGDQAGTDQSITEIWVPVK